MSYYTRHRNRALRMYFFLTPLILVLGAAGVGLIAPQEPGDRAAAVLMLCMFGAPMALVYGLIVVLVAHNANLRKQAEDNIQGGFTRFEKVTMGLWPAAFVIGLVFMLAADTGPSAAVVNERPGIRNRPADVQTSDSFSKFLEEMESQADRRSAERLRTA